MYSYGNFSAFFLWSPLGNYEKKSCLNKLKFWEASRNHKRSLSWEFRYSILKNTETSHIPASISENSVPLCYIMNIFVKNCPTWNIVIQVGHLCIIYYDKSQVYCTQHRITQRGQIQFEKVSLFSWDISRNIHAPILPYGLETVELSCENTGKRIL